MNSKVLKTLLTLALFQKQTQAAATIPLEINLTGVGDYDYHVNTLIDSYVVPTRGYHLSEFKYQSDGNIIYSIMLTFTTDALPATTLQSPWLGVLSPNLSPLVYAKNAYSTTVVPITKRIVSIRQISAHNVDQFVFYYKDGTTNVQTGPTMSMADPSFPRTFAGNFIGMRCKFHTDGARIKIDKLEACNIYEDQEAVNWSNNYVFVQTIADFSYTIGSGLSVQMYWETNYGLQPEYVESYSATYTKSGVSLGTKPTFLTFTPTLGNSYLTIQSNLAVDIGVYQVTISATITPTSSGSAIVKSFTFNFTILSDCPSTTLTSKVVNAMTNSVSTAAVTQNVSIADSKETFYSLPAYCGARTYTFSPLLSSLPFLTLTGTTLSLQTNNISNVSNQSVEMTVKLTDYPTIPSLTFNFLVTITCLVQTIIFSMPPAFTTTLRVGIDTQPVLLPFTIIQTPACGNVVTYTLTPTRTFLSLSTPGNVQISGATIANHNTYSQILTAAVDSKTATATFNVIIQDPCSTAVFQTNPQPLIDMTVSMPFTATSTQTVSILTNIQVTQPSIVCPITATLTSAAYLSLSADFKTISVNASLIVLPTDIGTHLFTLIVGSANFSGSVASQSYNFKVIIPCVVSSLTIASQAPNMVYTLNQGLLQTAAFTVNQTAVCNQPFTYTHTFVKDVTSIAQPTWITFDSSTRKFTMTITAPSDLGLYTIKSTATIPSALSTNYSFTLKVQSDCINSIIIDKTINDMITIWNDSPVTQDVTFADTIATAHGNPTYCGPRTYTFSQNQTFLTISGTTMSLQTTNPSEVRNYNILLTIALTDYPQVAPLTKNFLQYITEVDCQNQTLTMTTPNPPLQLITYMIEGPPKTIPFPQYSMTKIACMIFLDFKFELVNQTTNVNFNEHTDFNKPVPVGSLPEFIAFNVGKDIVIQGSKFSEGWNSYQFSLSALIQGKVVNTEFKFTVDTTIDCETDMKFQPLSFTSQINYLIGSTAFKNSLAFTDSKSIRANIKEACGPIIFTLNSTDILANEIMPLPKFIKFESNQIQIKTADLSLAGTTYYLLLDVGLTLFKLTQHKTWQIPVELTIPAFAILVEEQKVLEKNTTQSLTYIDKRFEIKPPEKKNKDPVKFTSCYMNRISAFGRFNITINEPVLTTLVPENITSEFLSVKFLQHSYETPIKMSYNVTNFTQTRIEIQLTFDQPLLVSADFKQRDEIVVNLSQRFLVPITNLAVTDDQVFEFVEVKSIMPQMVSSQAELTFLEGMAKTVKTVSLAMVIVPFLAQFFLKGIMKKLWAFFHAMQIIESLSLLYAASLPMNAQLLQNAYHDIINAKLIPDFVMEKIKGAFRSDNPDQPSLLRMLNSSASSRKIKRAVFVVGGSIPILLCVFLIALKLFWHRVPQSIKTKIKSIKYMIFWNLPIRTMLEIFYPMISHSLVTLYNPQNYPDATVIQSIIQFCLLSGFCIFVLNFLIKNYRLVEDRDYQKKFGSFFTNIEIYNNSEASYYSFVFLLHRILMAITMTCLGKVLVVQVLLMTHFNLALLSWLLIVRPMDTQYKNLLEIINTKLVLVMCYFVFCFSDYVNDPIAKYKIGYVYIAIIISFFAFNLAFQTVIAIKELYIQKKNKQRILARKEEERLEQGKTDPKRLTLRELLAQKIAEALQPTQVAQKQVLTDNKNNIEPIPRQPYNSKDSFHKVQPYLWNDHARDKSKKSLQKPTKQQDPKPKRNAPVLKYQEKPDELKTNELGWKIKPNQPSSFQHQSDSNSPRDRVYEEPKLLDVVEYRRQEALRLAAKHRVDLAKNPSDTDKEHDPATNVYNNLKKKLEEGKKPRFNY